MAKRDHNFLKAVVRQLAEARENRDEWWFEFGELCADALEAVGALSSGDPDDEAGGCDSDGGTPDLEGSESDTASSEDSQSGLAGLVREVERLRAQLHGVRDVPRGTGSGVSVLMPDKGSTQFAGKRICEVPGGTK